MLSNVFNKQITFLIGAVSVKDLPTADVPEVCFIGRSNVGKSSLINALTQNNKVARVSKTPGCTQQLNFFDIGQAFTIVDLPGYGYARASKHKIKHWNALIFDYLRGRQQLSRVFMLIDTKVGFTRSDEEALKYLESYGIGLQFIMTKTDKNNRQIMEEQSNNLKKVIAKYANCHTEILACSSTKKFGLEEIRDTILGCVNS